MPMARSQNKVEYNSRPLSRRLFLKPKKQKGFTLVELLVALSMGLIVLTVMFTMFRTSNRSYILQDYVAEMQQNLRVGMHSMSRDIRMAGCGMNLLLNLVPSIEVFNGSSWSYVTAISGTNSSTGPDRIDMFIGDINSGEYDALITHPMPDASAELNVDKVGTFNDGDHVIVTNGIHAALFVVSAVQGAALKIQHNPAESLFNPPAAFKAFPHGGGYGTGSRLYNFGALRFVSYYIDNTTDPDHPVLMADLHLPSGPQVIADNIEDIQFHYFLEDGTDTDNPAGNEGKIRSVRMTIVARTAEQDFDTVKFTPPIVEDHDPGTVPPDGYRRRVLSSIIKVRNL